MNYEDGRRKSLYNDMFDKKLIMECYRGSKSHNLYVPPTDKFGTDDIDLINVYHYSKAYYLTLEGYNRAKEVYEEKEREFDTVGYELRKFFHLLQELNPNILVTLYLRKEDYITVTPAWDLIMANKRIFVGKHRIRDTFAGYANSQLKKMEMFNKQGYMGDKRAKLVKEFGFDTKNASHLIRLLKMGIEFLRDGEPIIFRTADRQELLDIKRGSLSLEQVKEYGERLFKQLNEEYEKSKLPELVNKCDVNKLLYEVMEMVLELPPEPRIPPKHMLK